MYRKNLVFSAAAMGMLLFGIVFLSLGTISTFIQAKFHIGQLSAASLASSLPFGMLLGSVVFGPVVDRYGYRIMLIVSSALILLAFEAIAFAGSFFVLQIAFFIIGFGGGTINGGTNALAADIAGEQKGSKLSLLGVFFGIGALAMPVVTGILSKHYSYETIISSIGIFVALPIVFFSVIAFPAPKQPQGFPLKSALRLIKEPMLLLLGLVLFFESGLEGMIGNWTTSFLTNAGLTTEDALYALSLQVAALALARLLLSGLIKKITPQTVLFISFAIVLAGAVVLSRASSFSLAALAMVLFGFGFAACFPVILGYVGERYPGLSGTAFSIVIVLALTGNTLLNYTAGAVSSAFGIDKFPLLLVLCVVCMVLVFTIVLKKKNKLSESANRRITDARKTMAD